MDDFGYSGVSKLDVESEFFKGVEYVVFNEGGCYRVVSRNW